MKKLSLFGDVYPNLASLIDDGYEVEINGRAGSTKICSICNDHSMIVVFPKGRMRVDAVLSKLEKLADEYVNGGWINDELNGERYCVD